MHEVRGEAGEVYCVLSSMFDSVEQGVGMNRVCSYQGGTQVEG